MPWQWLDGRSGIERTTSALLAQCLKDSSSVQTASARVFRTFWDNSTVGEVSRFTKSAVRLLRVHQLVVGCIMSCGGVLIGFVSFIGVFLLYTPIWQPKGSASEQRGWCNGGHDQVLGNGRDVIGAGKPKSCIDNSRSLSDRHRYPYLSTPLLYYHIHPRNRIFSYTLIRVHTQIYGVTCLSRRFSANLRVS